jgi:hypothetical protein
LWANKRGKSSGYFGDVTFAGQADGALFIPISLFTIEVVSKKETCRKEPNDKP